MSGEKYKYLGSSSELEDGMEYEALWGKDWVQRKYDKMRGLDGRDIDAFDEGNVRVEMICKDWLEEGGFIVEVKDDILSFEDMWVFGSYDFLTKLLWVDTVNSKTNSITGISEECETMQEFNKIIDELL